MTTLLRRGAVYRWLSGALPLLFSCLPAVAQHSESKVEDTVVVSPKEVQNIVDSMTKLANFDKDSGALSVDSASLSPATTKADAVVARSVPDSVIDSWKKDKDFAYANNPYYWKEDEPAKSGPSPFWRWVVKALGSEGFKYFIYFLLGSILLYAIIRVIAENNLRMFYRPPGKKKAGQDDETSPLEEDLEGQLQLALDAGDHRMAVRYLYLKTLRLLSDRELIRYHIQATNREYVGQLSGSGFGDAFRFLTGAYDRVWYGEFALGDGQFNRLHQYFQDFYKSIGG
jgi:hypothetical protein